LDIGILLFVSMNPLTYFYVGLPLTPRVTSQKVDMRCQARK